MSSGMVTTTIAGRTDIGMVRANNEDMFLMVEPDTGYVLDTNMRLERPLERQNLLLIVSDGMGGYEGGEVASLLTVDAIKTELAKLPRQLSPQSRLEAAVEEANRVVWQQRKVMPKLHSMGATATAVLIEHDTVYVAEVGDSRAYILRDGRIKQLTTDQTMVQMLVDSGAITPEAAAVSNSRNILLQAIGSQEFLQIAVSSIQLQSNDILLLCSDGLSGKLNANEIKAIIEQTTSLDAAALAMIEEAKRRGGEDNITTIIAKFEGGGLSANLRASATLTKQIKVLTRFDPEVEAQAKPKREVRPATFNDWLASAVIDAFARSEEQRNALAALGAFGDYVLFRKGDVLVSKLEAPVQDHYWLLAGRFRVMTEGPNNEKQTLAFLVPPTDRRADALIQESEPFIRVKRQFFTASLSMMQEQSRNTTIRCEDDENIAIRIPYNVFQKVADILGERFITTVRYS